MKDADIGNAQAHNEREKSSYVNQDIVPERTQYNVHFKTPTAGYKEMFEQMRSDGVISTRGLKADAEKFGELIFDVNSAYFFNHGGYEFAKQFYADAYKAAIKIVGGEQYILSAVMHADERNRAMSDALASCECMISRLITSHSTRFMRFAHSSAAASAIFDFNTPRTVAALGTAVSEINEQVLRQIEVTIRNYEREHSAERTAEHGEQPDLHDERRLPDSRPEDRGAGAAPRQVRADAPEVPEGASAHPLEPDDLGGSPVPAPAGDRAGGAEPSGADDAGTGGGGRSDGGTESSRPNEMGGPDEHLQGAGGGSDSRGADLRITEHPARGGQLSFFPTEAEQITAIEEAESAQTPFAFSVSQAQLDHVLRLGGNEDDTRMVIAAAFQKQKSVEDIAALLQSTFHGGNGFKTPEGELSAWYAVDGIHIAPGRSAEYVRSAQVIAWQDAAARISQLMDSGAYASNVELAEAGQHERMQLAQALWYLKHDLSDEAREQGYLSCMDTLRGGGFPDETARLAEQLTNTAFGDTLSGEFAQFYAAHEQDRSLLRFHYHKLDQIWQSLRDLSLPRREYSSEMTAVPELARFITEDEIDHALDRGSGVEGGKGRVYEYFTADHTGKEKAAFLKDEYGIGGRSHAVSGASHSGENHDSRGITLKKADCANVELSWTKVAARIDSLIQKDRFLSPREKERYAQLQREKEAERELPTQAQTDYNAIKEAHPDDIVLFQVGDFFEMYGEDAKQAAELLGANT